MEYLYDASATISPATTAELPTSIGHGPHDSASSAASTPPMKKKRNDSIRRAPGGTQAQHGEGLPGGHVASTLNAGAARGAALDNKPKRVRTGCLTCRERHLKCDEGRPDCQNCVKSQRECKRGIRLNYIDFQTSDRNAYFIPRGKDWTVAFQDESREIAKEYNGDWRYPPEKRSSSASNTAAAGNNFYYMSHQSGMAPPPAVSHQPLPPIQGILPESYPQEQQQYSIETQQAPSHRHGRGHSRESVFSGTATAPSPYSIEASASPAPAPGARDYLTSQEEVLFMQVFVEEVGIWMDSMDSQKHFSRLLPFHALSEPMLLNSFFACGARHLALVNPKYSEDKALAYYDMATRHLLDSLQDPNRDTVLCATTAVILNVYEIMCERALQRMNHIAGARALIKECGWNAKASGIGAACFWLNVGMEILSCLHFNWQVAWDPDDWGVDLDFSRETESGKEELWTHRILYIVAKVCNFRASIPRNEEVARQTLETRHAQWLNLKKMADRWNENIPRTMHPLAYLYPGSTISGSAFPEVWLIKRTSIVARLFYHTSLVLLGQINPIKGPTDPEMQSMLDRHSQLICGISAHVKDRGVASVALRSLAIAAECLTERREQEEVLQIFDKIRQETGWRVGFLNAELKKKWGWDAPPPPPPPPTVDISSNSSVQSDTTLYQQQDQAHQAHQAHQAQMALQQTTPTTIQVPVPPPAPAPARPAFPTGVMNPILATADFSMPQHPYQTHYVAPNSMHQAPQQQQQPPTQQGHPTGDYYYKHFTN